MHPKKLNALLCGNVCPTAPRNVSVIGKTGILVSKSAKQIYASIILKQSNEKLPIIFRR